MSCIGPLYGNVISKPLITYARLLEILSRCCNAGLGLLELNDTRVDSKPKTRHHEEGRDYTSDKYDWSLQGMLHFSKGVRTVVYFE